ncbi:MAG: GGDEF domain-containing protein [Spirochaetota bacterium]
MKDRAPRTLALIGAFALYAAGILVVYILARQWPRTAEPVTLEVLSEAVLGLVALLWSIILFREMDTVHEQVLIFVGIGLVAIGAWEDTLDEFYELPFELEMLENVGLPVGLTLVTAGLAIRMLSHRAYANRLRTERDAIESVAMKDPLTGLYNRRYLRRELEQLLDDADAHHRPICLLFIDADNFKQINDRLGHDTGDAFLIGLGRAITSAVRDSDIAVRFGGDEFVVLLVGSSLDYAVHVAERIQASVRKLARPYGATGRGLGKGELPSVSIGLAAHVPDESGLQLIARADEAMYAAKRSGKDRLAVA